jgi:zinc and cadmium transporter
MGPDTVLIVYCACIVAASLAGGLVPVLLRLTHRRLQFGLSFVSGVMLGVALFHMVPHALMARMETAGADVDSHALFDPLMLALALGFVAMFFLERFAHFHQHEAPEPACDDPMHGHEGHHHHGHDHAHAPVGRLTWAGAAVDVAPLTRSRASSLSPDGSPVMTWTADYRTLLHQMLAAAQAYELYYPQKTSYELDF